MSAFTRAGIVEIDNLTKYNGRSNRAEWQRTKRKV
jgi:hypothetical protein